MRNKLVAQRYAKALMDFAIEKNELEQTKVDIDLIRAITTQELRSALASPVISDQEKTEIFRRVFKDKLSPLTFSFFDLVFSKRRELVLPEIADEFFERYRELKGIETIEITTAVEISDEIRINLQNRFQALPRFKNKTVRVITKVDED